MTKLHAICENIGELYMRVNYQLQKNKQHELWLITPTDTEKDL